MSVELFARELTLQLDQVVINDLRVAFDILKTNKPEPNDAAIAVWNLNETHRKALEASQGVQVKLEAGYKGGKSVLYLGDLREITTERDAQDFITTVSSGDGEDAFKSKRISESFGPGTPIDQILTSLTTALGLGPGNVATIGAKLRAQGSAIFKSGTVLSGRVSDQLTDVARSVGVEWSIQNGTVVFTLRGKALESTAIKLDKTSGLIGLPTVDAKGKLNCRILLQPDVYPSRLVLLATERLQGLYRIEECRFIGDTRAQDWYVDLVCGKL